MKKTSLILTALTVMCGFALPVLAQTGMANMQGMGQMDMRQGMQNAPASATQALPQGGNMKGAGMQMNGSGQMSMGQGGQMNPAAMNNSAMPSGMQMNGAMQQLSR